MVEDIDALGHNISTEWTVDTEATCTVDGSKSHHCTRCDEKFDVTSIDALGHNYGEFETVKEPTCTEKGSKKKVCARCNDAVSEDIDALGHDWATEWTVDKEESCAEYGSKSHHCSRCDAKNDVTVIEKKQHTLKATKIVIPTCTEQGYTLYVCTVCKNEFREDPSNPLGHAYGDWKLEANPDCENRGSSARVCSVCGNVDRTYTDPLGHDFGGWSVEKEATVLAEGKEIRTCSRCEKTEERAIEKITIDIDSNPNYGLANFTVVDIDLNPIKGACIFVYTENDGENTFETDENGKVSIVLPVGKQAVQAYAKGLHARNLKVNIVAGEQDIPLITLSSDNLVDADINVTEMSYEDIINAGIDVDAEDNQQTYKWELKLTYDAIPDFVFEFYTTPSSSSSSSSSSSYYPGSSNVIDSKGDNGTRNSFSTNIGVRPVMNLNMTGYNQGDKITFGNYPQSSVTDGTLLDELNSRSASWDVYPVYVGEGNYIKKGDTGRSAEVMYYTDITYNGSKYRGIKIKSYRPALSYDVSASYTSYQDDNGYYTENVYWFKYEPMTWIVLKQNSYGVFVMSEKAIDSQRYYVSSVDGSGIKKWLSNEFALTAFTAEERTKIVTTRVSNCWCGNHSYTYEYIYLLSVKDVESEEYGFCSYDDEGNFSYNYELRCAEGTDYAKSLGLYDDMIWEKTDNDAWWIRGLGEPIGDGGGGGGGGGRRIGSGRGSDGTPFTVFFGGETEEELFFLVIWGEVHWLKEMFDVEMIVINKSKTDTVENCTATLKLPDGLSLATMLKGEQSLSQAIDHMDSDSTTSLHWYVRGDKEGYYDISADLAGTLMPFEEEFEYEFTASDSVHVYAGSAMHLTFTVPDGCYEGHDAVITVELENVSDKTLYNVSSFITDVFQYDSYYLDGDEDGLYYHARGGEVVPWQKGYAQKFEPGDKIILEVRTNILFHSRMFDNLAEEVGKIGEIKKMYDACEALLDLASGFDGVVKCASKNIDNIIEAASITGTELALAYGKLSVSLAKLGAEIAEKSKSKIAAIGSALMDSDVWDEIVNMSNDSWDYSSVDAQKVEKLAANLEAALEAAALDDEDPFALIEDVVSLLPVRYQLLAAVVSTRDGSTTTIPSTIKVEHIESPYKGVINMGSLLYNAVIAGMGKMDVPFIFRALGVSDDPTGYRQAMQTLKTARDTLKALQVKSGVKDTRVKAWVVSKNTAPISENSVALLSNENAVYTNGYVELSVDENDTARIVDGVLEFDGNATLNVKALGDVGGTLYVDMGDGDVFEYDIEVVEEHECSSDKWVTVLPSVNGGVGYQACYCDVCDELIGFRETESCSEHAFGEWQNVLDATCLANGVKVRECTVCAYKQTDFIEGEHTEELRNVVAATCTEPGYSGDKYCKVCGVELEKGADVPALGHTFGEWTVTKAATCTEEGVEERKCANCEYKEERNIEKIAHSLGEWTVDTEATCTEEGVEERKCENCIYFETQAIAKTGHTLEWVETKAATCTEPGSRYRKCTVCDEILVAEKVIPAHGHEYEDGRCVNCGDIKGGCKHICHEQNWMARFFWKTMLRILKLFRLQKVCDCGVAHY